MEKQKDEEDLIRGAALRGARSVTRSRQLQEDAVAYTFERWEDAVLRGKDVKNWEGWARRTAANAAKRLSSRRGAPSPSTPRHEADFATVALVAFEAPTLADAREDSEREPANCRRLLRAHLALRRNLLRGRQLDVALKMSERGMSFHRAAKELAMPRCNVRRSFRSAMRRLLMVQK